MPNTSKINFPYGFKFGLRKTLSICKEHYVYIFNLYITTFYFVRSYRETKLFHKFQGLVVVYRKCGQFIFDFD